jgi:hypothetical protein
MLHCGKGARRVQRRIGIAFSYNRFLPGIIPHPAAFFLQPGAKAIACAGELNRWELRHCLQY